MAQIMNLGCFSRLNHVAIKSVSNRKLMLLEVSQLTTSLLIQEENYTTFQASVRQTSKRKGF